MTHALRQLILVFHKFLSDSGWAQVGVGLLIAVFTCGTLVFTGFTMLLQWKDRRERSKPEIETRISPISGHPEWWGLQLIFRNFGVTTVQLERLSLVKPRGFGLVDLSKINIVADISTHHVNAPEFDYEPKKAERSLGLKVSLAPLGSKNQTELAHRFAGYDLPTDRADISLFLFAPSWTRQHVFMRLTARRKGRTEKLMSIRIRVGTSADGNG